MDKRRIIRAVLFCAALLVLFIVVLLILLDGMQPSWMEPTLDPTGLSATAEVALPTVQDALVALGLILGPLVAVALISWLVFWTVVASAIKNFRRKLDAQDAARWRVVRGWFSIEEIDDGNGTLGLFCNDVPEPLAGESVALLLILDERSTDEHGEAIERAQWPTVESVIDGRIA